MVPLGASVGSAPGGISGEGLGLLSALAMLKWPFFPPLGAVTWEGTAGGQVWLGLVLRAEGWVRAVVRA